MTVGKLLKPALRSIFNRKLRAGSMKTQILLGRESKFILISRYLVYN